MAWWGGGWTYEPDYYPSGGSFYATGAGANQGGYNNSQIDTLIKNSYLPGTTCPTEASLDRGTGVGDHLVNTVITWAKFQGAARVILSVKTGNDAAIRLYQRHQFVEGGPSPESLPESPEVLFARMI